MKILRNLCLHFARQDGKDRKNPEENHETDKRQKIWDERNNTHKINRLDTIQLFEYFIEKNLLSNL